MSTATRIAITGAIITTVALGWTWWRSGAAADAVTATGAARQELTRLGAPDPLAVTAAENAVQAQVQALEEAAKIAPPLPEAYLATDVASAAKRVRDDLEALRLRADRLRIGLPRQLPFEAGLDANPSVRATQLALLAAIRATVDHLLDAGVASIGSLDTQAWSDPSGTYACLGVKITAESSPAGLQNLLQGFQHSRDLSVHHLAVTAKDGGGLQVSGLIVRLTPNQAEWALQPEATPSSSVPGATSPKSPKAAKGLGGR